VWLGIGRCSIQIREKVFSTRNRQRPIEKDINIKFLRIVANGIVLLVKTFLVEIGSEELGSVGVNGY